MFTYMDDCRYENMKKKSKENIFNIYLRFSYGLNELNEEEKALLNTKAEEFMNMLETASMTKTHKFSVFLAFYNEGNFKAKVDDEDMYKRFKNFYSKASNGIDFRDISQPVAIKTGEKKNT